MCVVLGTAAYMTAHFSFSADGRRMMLAAVWGGQNS